MNEAHLNRNNELMEVACVGEIRPEQAVMEMIVIEGTVVEMGNFLGDIVKTVCILHVL